MASGKVARPSAASDLGSILDSPEVSALVADLDALRWTGRKGYGARAMVGACLVKSLYALPTWTRVAALIEEHPRLSEALGGCPSIWACYRFCNKLRHNEPILSACLDRVVASLHAAMPEYGRNIAIDASDAPAFANGQRFVRNGGALRERYADPDASWGHRSAVSTRAAGSFYGFKIHAAICTNTELPIAWRIETAKRNESLFVAPLLDACRARGVQPETCAMDAGYDHERVHAEARERDCIAVVPLRKGRKPRPRVIQNGTDEWFVVYRGRGAVEREFGRLKHEYGFAPLRVRGLARVQLHADLVILARLGQVLSRARAVPLAA